MQSSGSFSSFRKRPPNFGDRLRPLEPSVDWDAIRGIGNIIRHNYDEVEDRVLQHVLTRELEPLDEACRRLVSAFDDET